MPNVAKRLVRGAMIILALVGKISQASTKPCRNTPWRREVNYKGSEKIVNSVSSRGETDMRNVYINVLFVNPEYDAVAANSKYRNQSND